VCARHPNARWRAYPPGQAYDGQCVASTRASLRDTVSTVAWAEGRAMTLEQAVEYALAVETGSGEVA